MKLCMNKNTLAYVILITLIVAATLAALWATSTFWLPPSPWRQREFPRLIHIPGDIEVFYTVKTVFSTINVVLSVFLSFIYVNIYRKTRSEFTIGLIIFSIVFLLNALVSNPFMIWAFGFQPFGLGPFALLPDLFTFGALAILLYLSIRY